MVSDFIEYCMTDVLNTVDDLTSRKMMGGHVLYSKGKPFAIVHNETLWFKGSLESKAWYLHSGAEQFSYIRKGKVMHLYYFSVPEEVYEDRQKIEEWLCVALP